MSLPIPTLMLGFIIASLYGALYHLVRGGGFWRMMLYLLLSWIGFTAGHFMGEWLNWIFLPVGLLDLGPATIGSLIMLGVGDWLSRIEITPERRASKASKETKR